MEEQKIKKIDKIITTITITIIALIIITTITTIIQQKKFDKNTRIPTQKEINETCYQHKLIPDGYTKDYTEQKIYINCKKIFIPPEKIISI